MSNQSNHTPGPWQADAEFKDIDSISPQAQGQPICRTPAYKSSGRFEEEKANALLIAAAPDLLRAAKAGLVYAEQAMELLGLSEEDEEPIAMIREAIRKSEGK